MLRAALTFDGGFLSEGLDIQKTKTHQLLLPLTSTSAPKTRLKPHQ
jgi:hypothetical protein